MLMLGIAFSSHNIFKCFQRTPLTNVKKIDCALLLPSRRSLHMHLLRAHYVSIMWSRASSPFPADGLSPLENGWCRKNYIPQPVWFNGSALPDSLFREESNEGNNDVIDMEKETVAESDNEFSAQFELSDSDDEPWSEDSHSGLDYD